MTPKLRTRCQESVKGTGGVGAIGCLRGTFSNRGKHLAASDDNTTGEAIGDLAQGLTRQNVAAANSWSPTWKIFASSGTSLRACSPRSVQVMDKGTAFKPPQHRRNPYTTRVPHEGANKVWPTVARYRQCRCLRITR